MAKSKETPAVSTTTSGPPAEYKPYFDQLVQFASKSFQGAKNYDVPDRTVEGFTAPQQTAQGNILDLASGPLAALAKQLGGATEYGLNSFLTPDSDVVQNAATAAINPVMRMFTESILPNLRGEAQLSGNVGSSRQGVAEGLAVDSLARQAFDTSASVTNQAFQTGQDTLLKTMGLAPSSLQAMLFPDLATSGVGENIQQQKQRESDVAVDNEVAQQNQEQTALANFANILFGLPYSQSTGTQQAAQGGGGGLQAGIGNAISGASLGMKIGGPWGAAVGGGLGVLSSLF